MLELNAQIYAVTFFAGVLAHLAAFRIGEWDLYTPQLLAGSIILDGLIAYSLLVLTPDTINAPWQAFCTASSLLGVAVAGIYSSILVYRAAFHRLNRFPGPFAARLSNFYVTGLSVKKFRLYEEVQRLHQKHGDIVRLGPSELSIADPTAINLIHSNQSPCYKGPWYDIMHPVVSLHVIRDRKEHSRRRRTWDKGLNVQALRDYEPRVAEYTAQLLRQIEKSEGKPLDMAAWFNFYSFDVMGNLAFGKGFNMLKDGVVHYHMKSVHANMLAVGAFSHLVWIFPLLKTIPILNNEHVKFQSWLAEQVARRRKAKSGSVDLFSWLLADYDAIKSPTPEDYRDLQGDAHLIVVAGSDTTAAALTCLFYELAYHPEVVEKLQKEVDGYYVENEQPSHVSLGKLVYLQSCIDESLRLHPPVPSGLQRMTPPEGLQVGGIFIPGNTIVVMPTYTIQRGMDCSHLSELRPAILARNGKMAVLKRR